MLSMQRDDMKYPRDYLTPGPSKDFSGFIPKIVEPPGLANYFRMVLSRLCTPRFAEGRWTLSEQLLLVPQTLNLFWTGHSARHFATQTAAAIGVDKEKRDYLGRWAIGRVGSNAYLHTSRQVVDRERSWKHSTNRWVLVDMMNKSSLKTSRTSLTDRV